jgi:pSer/pThr/pTyr-binding forkhead associated (FHA) protein
MWKLSIEDDQANKTVVSLVRDEYSIGRGEENTVRLTERNISRRHSKLTRNGTGWILDDLASYNGCFVNGVRVSEPQTLEHGDLLQVGDYRLEITDEQVANAVYSKSTVPGANRTTSLLSEQDRLFMLAGPSPGAEYALSGQRVVIGRGEECDVSVNHASVSRVHAEICASTGWTCIEACWTPATPSSSATSSSSSSPPARSTTRGLMRRRSWALSVRRCPSVTRRRPASAWSGGPPPRLASRRS